MAQTIGLATEKSAAKRTTRETSRLYYLDHLRAALVMLVVLHHLAVVYGEGISFWYVDPPPSESLGGLLLLLLVLFNQAWFMGALFLIAGYFTPGSFERKGSTAFLKGRMTRLGIPLLIWIFILCPISAIGIFLEPVVWVDQPLTWQTFWQFYPGLIGLGVAWFLALLLIFSFGYALYREPTKHDKTEVVESPPPSYLTIGIFILALALVSYLVRIAIPLGRSVLDFPTLAYLPQYLSFFIVGAVAYRHNWFHTLPGRLGVAGLGAAIVATILFFAPAFGGVLAGGEPAFLGNGTWQSALYALWDATFAVGLCLASITFFRRFFNDKSSLGSFLSQQSYAVYVIHSPIIVFVAYALYRLYAQRGIDPGPLLKFAIGAAIVLPICYGAAYLIRKIPGVSRVL